MEVIGSNRQQRPGHDSFVVDNADFLWVLQVSSSILIKKKYVALVR
jgi:hypothetical protein